MVNIARHREKESWFVDYLGGSLPYASNLLVKNLNISHVTARGILYYEIFPLKTHYVSKLKEIFPDFSLDKYFEVYMINQYKNKK